MYQVVMPAKLTPTGISGLDNVIGGGFQKGSMVMLAGNPGTGKTVLASRFLATGITDFGEPGIYVSFGESKDTLVSNMVRQFGPEIGKALRNEKIKFLEYTVMTEVGLEAVLKTILDEITKMGAKRLVIDSYSAMAPLFEKGAVRTVLHSVLGELIREVGCTTIVICEVPRGDTNLGTGVEEFVADGVMLLSTHEIDGRPIRELEILKMRGSKLEKTKCVFSLEGGIQVFEQISLHQSKTPPKFKTIPDSQYRYSTGLTELDTILSGGYLKGDVVLVEVGENVTSPEYNMFTLPCIKNFLGHGKAVIDIPSVGVGTTLPDSLIRYGGLGAEQLDKLLTLCIPKEHLSVVPKNSKVWTFDSSDVAGSLANFPAMINTLTQKFRQTSLYIEGVDTLFSSFGPENVVKLLNATITASRNHGNLNMMILRPGIPAPALYDMCKSIADVHLKLIKKEGTLLFLGLKPWTGMYAVQTDLTLGYPWPRLAPLV
jgi:KaiC/GvpD/RAD55 family RecA-like ATPase